MKVQNPQPGDRVVVAMSGGVDSSVAAALLKKQGCDVVGISLQLHDMAQKTDNKFGTCCSLSDIEDARRVCEKIDVPFYVVDMEKSFKENVINNFVDEYVKGRTPNPCVKCNQKVKFKQLMYWAEDMGADYLATGHYARVGLTDNGPQLWRGEDKNKDQSYFLFMLSEMDLKKTVFPIGNLSKPQVREMAHEIGLGIASKPDSQEICFVQGKRYSDFVEEVTDKKLSGNIVDRTGTVLGTHSGIYEFTIGQRKGLGVASHKPLFVTHIDVETNNVTVGDECDLWKQVCMVDQMTWVSEVSAEDLGSLDSGLTAKIRYRSQDTPVVLHQRGGQWSVHFVEKQRAMTPGQVMVVYRGEQVLGGGWISHVESLH